MRLQHTVTRIQHASRLSGSTSNRHNSHTRQKPVCVILCVTRFISSVGYLPHLVTLGDKYGTLQVTLWSPADLSSTLQRLADSPKDICLASFSIAFVAVLESLISGKLADEWTHTEMDSGQEVLALGVANLACGVAGGLPAHSSAGPNIAVHSQRRNRTQRRNCLVCTDRLAGCRFTARLLVPAHCVWWLRCCSKWRLAC